MAAFGAPLSGLPVVAQRWHEPGGSSRRSAATHHPHLPISRARLVAINARDPDAAMAFWRDKIGFTVQSDAAYGDGDRWIEVIPPGAETGLTIVGPANPNWSEPEDWSPALFACDDIDHAVTELSARGVEFTGPVMRMEGGAPPMAFLLDQDGRRFLLTERTD